MLPVETREEVVHMNNTQVKFPLGQVVVTPGALQALEEAGQSPVDFLRRHVVGD